MNAKHRVVIVGGGFGGLNAALALRDERVDVTLVDRRNFHLFQPLLYQVATGGLSPANIASPLRAILRKRKNVRVILGEVVEFDLANNEVVLTDGRFPFDSLIVAAGASHSYFGRDDWQVNAPGLKTIEDATEIRARILTAFELAERSTDPVEIDALLRFVVVGAGPTGVEMAGAIAEIARHTLAREFRTIEAGSANVVLVEAADRVLGAFDPKSSAKALMSLERLGIDVKLKTAVAEIAPDSVTLKSSDDTAILRTRTVIWAAGVKASPLAGKLAAVTNATADRAGRLIVEPDLTLRGHSNIFAIGDLATYSHQTGKPLPGLAPVAMQQGRYVGRLILGRLAGRETAPFRYTDRGIMATIGRAAAVAEIGPLKFAGLFAWQAWLFVHLMLLVKFESRILVFIQWAWSYFTWNRSARLISGHKVAGGQTNDRQEQLMADDGQSRSQLADDYIAALPYPPYPVQEEALLSWFTSEQGTLVCAPTGTGKTLIAQAALYEALRTGKKAYYTTPLIALTEQKFQEMRRSAEAWGFNPDDIGLLTGNRKVNPNAPILIVVAEILLNRLLTPEAHEFEDVTAIVVDEFHSFSDPERGIVWELTLGLVPPKARLLLLSATVGNATEFVAWLQRSHGRKIELVQSNERRVPLTFCWVGDKLLNEQVEVMAEGSEAVRKTPALIFCFNRDECWSVAEQLKGLSLLDEGRKKELAFALDRHDWTQGVGPKIRQMLMRGVGVHHAGLLPKYKRVVEALYERKLLAACVCTETLAAGINLPARSVVLSTLVKGPRGKKKIIDPSSAHQIFGRAGRPQFDAEGFVYVLAHEDDVKILRWQKKYDSIPDATKDPNLIKVKKDLWRKRPTRRDTEQYWTEAQFQKLVAAPAGNLQSRGNLPWRVLAHLLRATPEVEVIRAMIRKRLLDAPKIEAGIKALDRALVALHHGGFVKLEPPPPTEKELAELRAAAPASAPKMAGLFSGPGFTAAQAKAAEKEAEPAIPKWSPALAVPTEKLPRLLVFRGVHPIYANFLVDYIGIADKSELLQALESMLELPRSVLRYVRPPTPEEVPPGPLATTKLDAELLQRGVHIAKIPDFSGNWLDEDDFDDGDDDEEEYRPPLADKLRMLFNTLYPEVKDVRTQAVWSAGEILRFGGDFNKYVRTHDLVKQEGIVFRHALRLILLCAEFAAVCPPDREIDDWRADCSIAEELTQTCHQVDPTSTEKSIENAVKGAIDEAAALAAEAVLEPQAVPDEAANWKRTFEQNWDSLLAELRAV